MICFSLYLHHVNPLSFSHPPTPNFISCKDFRRVWSPTAHSAPIRLKYKPASYHVVTLSATVDLGEKQRPWAQAMHYLGRHTPLATATRWRILQAGSASATCVTSCAIQITHTDRARTLLNHSHMPGVVLSQITARARGKKQEAAHHLLLKVPGPRVGGGVLICNLVSFGGKLNDILDPVILGEKSERKIIRTVHCKPKESSLRQGLIFQHLIWFLKFKKKKKKAPTSQRTWQIWSQTTTEYKLAQFLCL